MQKYNILWADDEIDLLKPHILFLEERGYQITPVNSGADAVDEYEKESFDVVFLDENMPGMTGLETLNHIKNINPNTPVVMITKSEEEHIMDEAIGSKIADYLIKPLNPNQILLSVKKILQNKKLIQQRTNLGYQQDFQNISLAFGDELDHQGWSDIYRKLVFWELEIDAAGNKGMYEVLENQKSEANTNFARFIISEYEHWLQEEQADRPLLSHDLIKQRVLPEWESSEGPLFFILVDNLRFDQWKIIEPIINEYFKIQSEETYYSILPTTTAYARNAIFSGRLPLEMAKHTPKWWVGEEEDNPKNNFEEELLQDQLSRLRKPVKMSYYKIKNAGEGKQVSDQINNLMQNDLNVMVFNFVDMLSHARTDMQMIRELAPDESAYRSITRSWFEHSPLLDVIKKISDQGARLILTTDHGTIRVKRPFKIIGDRKTNTNLRYKQGRNLGYDSSDKIFEVAKPERLHLPRVNVSTSFVFATEDQFFAYPNNFNYYVNYYHDTFQHGGISLEEVIIPYISLNSR